MIRINWINRLFGSTGALTGDEIPYDGTDSLTAKIDAVTVTKASQAEVDAGVEDTKFVTPAKLKASPSNQLAIYEDNKTNGTDGGSSSVGNNTRVINTTKYDPSSLGSLSANAVTLVAGTYLVEASAPAFRADSHQLSLYDGSTYVVVGTSSKSKFGGDNTIARSTLEGVITADGIKAYSLRHYIASAFATTGLGASVSSGRGEVYTRIKFTKLS